MKFTRRLLTIAFCILALAGLPAHSQQCSATAPFFPPIGDDITKSLGKFRIRVADQFTTLFTGCGGIPGYTSTTKILESPLLSDGNTIIGRSNPFDDDAGLTATDVGTAKTVISEQSLYPPPGFPCYDATDCTSGPQTREVLTEIRSLRMLVPGAPPGSIPAVRAGLWYNNATSASLPPNHFVSRGKVESRFGPTPPPNDPSKDFGAGGASSFFDVFVQVDLPVCNSGSVVPASLHNELPLTVKNPQIFCFPPKVVYLHDASSIVPIVFDLDDPGGLWRKGDVLGYFVLAGHGVGFDAGTQSDIDLFNSQVNQNTTCPIP